MTQSDQPALGTLLFFVRQKGGVEQVFLGIKQRGQGSKKWNAPGGHVDPGESIEVAARREGREESGAYAGSIDKCAEIAFRFPQESNPGFDVYCYICREWEGDPGDSDELRNTRWFDLDKVPYDQMWAADREWIAQVLSGQKIKGSVNFDVNRQVIDSCFEAVSGFDIDVGI